MENRFGEVENRNSPKLVTSISVLVFVTQFLPSFGQFQPIQMRHQHRSTALLQFHFLFFCIYFHENLIIFEMHKNFEEEVPSH